MYSLIVSNGEMICKRKSELPEERIDWIQDRPIR